MRYLIVAPILLLTACSPIAAEVQGTAMALAVELTLLAQPTSETILASESSSPTVTSPSSEAAAATETSTSVQIAAPSMATSPPLPAPTQPAPAQLSEPTETPYVVPNWPLVRRGDKGPLVYAIQHLLRSHGYNLSVDGLFGPETRQQVLNFQLAKNLSTDGIVGPQTWTALIQGKTVAVGSTGQAVRAVQRLLRDRLGYNEITVDGDFGPITDNVVVAMQNAYDLTPDGIVGPQTWKALVAASPLAQ